MGRLRASLLAGLAVAAVAIIECFAPTEITLQITTDIPCASLDGVAVIVGPPSELETRDPSTVTTMCDQNGIGTLVVTPSGVSGPVGIAVIAGTKGPPDVSAESCRAQNYLNCVVARREISFITHAGLTLPIELSSACENFPCPSDANNVQTCAVLNGKPQCVGASVDSKLCEDASASCEPTDDGGVTLADAADATSPPPLDAAAPGTPNRIAAGGNSTCVQLATNGTLEWWCWGANDSGQLAIDSGGQPILKPQHATSLDGYVDVAIGLNHGCGLDAKSVIECWGANGSGQLGDGAMNPHITPGTTNIAGEVVQVGDDFSCALTTQNGGTIICWGDNTHGQLGTGNNTSSAIPLQAMSNLAPFTELGANGAFACANANGTVACWGDNTFEQLDMQSGAMSTTIVSTGVPTGSVFAVGFTHACAVAGTSLTCWGNNDDHQASSDDASVVLGTPLQLSNSIKEAAAGAHHTCFVVPPVTDAGNIECVGDNTFGQVGNAGAPATTLTPTSLNAHATAIAAGYTHTCAVVANAVYCWGNNANGQLGDGTTTTRSTPVTVAW